jgi:L-ascorbate metabolism protein UlaG (beta-lactamase superfamily)
MVRVRILDDRLVAIQRQGRIGFHIGSLGEEAAILGSAFAMRESDWIFPCYREFGAALLRGMPLQRYVDPRELDAVVLSHLHADHTADLITLFGSFRKAGRQGPLYVWGGDGSEPKYGTKVALDAIEAACAWDTESTRGYTSNESAVLVGTEFDAATTSVVYEQDGVTITAFPVIHNLHGAVGYRVDFAGLSMVFSGDTHPCWPLVHAAQGTDLLIHECFPSAATLAALAGGPIERFQTITATHTVPKCSRSCSPAWARSGTLFSSQRWSCRSSRRSALSSTGRSSRHRT